MPIVVINNHTKWVVHWLVDEHALTFLGESSNRHRQGKYYTWRFNEPFLFWSPIETCGEPIFQHIEILIIRLGITKYAMVYAVQ